MSLNIVQGITLTEVKWQDHSSFIGREAYKKVLELGGSDAFIILNMQILKRLQQLP
jgi:hypothetical protein